MRRCRTTRVLGLLASGLVTSSALGAQATLPDTVTEDSVWSGVIDITHDVRLAGVTVRVEPGSVIRFVAADDARVGPKLHLGTAESLVEGRPHRASCRLILAGTADRPITVETPTNGVTGSIVAPSTGSCSIVARHVIFRQLGRRVSEHNTEPALLVRLDRPDDDLSLTNCRFEQCGPVWAEFAGDEAGAHVAHCTFTESIGRTALRFTGSGRGIKTVLDNVADAAFRVDCSQLLVRGNVLIGEQAAVALVTDRIEAIRIDGNYLHCTARQDNGRFALRCDAPGAVVSRNVLVGGTYVCVSAPRTVIGNVFVGVAGLEATMGSPGGGIALRRPTTTTHYLIGELAPAAVVRDNLFLGPAYGAVATGSRADRPRIENNLFDGWDVARRAVFFNVLADTPVGALFVGNVVTRYRTAPIVDQAGRAGTLAEARDNLFAEVPDPLYEKIAFLTDKAPGDRRLERFADLRLADGPTTRSALDVDQRLRDRQTSPAEVRDTWFAAYRPGPDSPLREDPGAGPRPSE